MLEIFHFHQQDEFSVFLWNAQGFFNANVNFHSIHSTKQTKQEEWSIQEVERIQLVSLPTFQFQTFYSEQDEEII